MIVVPSMGVFRAGSMADYSRLITEVNTKKGATFSGIVQQECAATLIGQLLHVQETA
jgi:hypothetical protein